ncbi:MAG: hypothetical protein KBC36_06985 [Spirochaetia bacterium]|nr:hypothetical protein [Spirochaetia bacterium]
MKRFALYGFVFAAAFAALAAPLAAQSDEDLFGAPETVEEAADAADLDRSEFLVWEAPRVSGRLSGSLGFSWSWNDPWAFESAMYDDYSMSPALSSRLTVQAKPEADWGYYAAFDLAYPFALDSSGGPSVPNISIYALYSNFSWDDALFFSFGKQPLRLGVGRFFQPADDLVSLSEIDVSDPEAEREGPLAFTALWPIPRTLSSVAFWTVFPKGAEKPEDMMYAAKAKHFFGDTELALVAAYKYDAPPSAFLMLNSGLWDLNVFGEAQLKYGSERTFLEPRAVAFPGLEFEAVEYPDRFFATATLGASYLNQESNLTVMAQYLWNGEAQTEATVAEAFAHYRAQTTFVELGTFPDESLFALDSLRWSRHYAAASVSLGELFGAEDLSASITAMANLSDLSGFALPQLSYRFFDYLSASLSARFTFGEEGDEFTMGPTGPGKPSASASLSITVGSGSF